MRAAQHAPPPLPPPQQQRLGPPPPPRPLCRSAHIAAAAAAAAHHDVQWRHGQSRSVVVIERLRALQPGVQQQHAHHREPRGGWASRRDARGSSLQSSPPVLPAPVRACCMRVRAGDCTQPHRLPRPPRMAAVEGQMRAASQPNKSVRVGCSGHTRGVFELLWRSCLLLRARPRMHERR